MLSCIGMAKCFIKENNVKMSYFYTKYEAIFHKIIGKLQSRAIMG